jgi:hypothetical protein
MAQSGYLLNSQSNHYVDQFGVMIPNLLRIRGQCSPFLFNASRTYYMQFRPTVKWMSNFNIALTDGIMDGSGFYESWVPLGDFIFPFIAYTLVVDGYCGIDNIGPQRLYSNSTGYTFQ